MVECGFTFATSGLGIGDNVAYAVDAINSLLKSVSDYNSESTIVT